MHEMWGATGSPAACISRTVLTVPSRVEPPAPYVTEKKCGRTCASRARAARNFCTASSDLGGKNSKLKVRSETFISSAAPDRSPARTLVLPHQVRKQRRQHRIHERAEHARPETAHLETVHQPRHRPEKEPVDHEQEQSQRQDRDRQCEQHQ